MSASAGCYTRLEHHYDRNKVCANPHKGWYLHYYDNSLEHYGSRLDANDFLLDFPGLNHIYLRLAWSYLEPQPGLFRWDIIDNIITPWVNSGRNVAFRITCVETDPNQCFATPQWVAQAGAKGTFLDMPGGYQIWEPIYDDAVFLDRLEQFHRAFAARYGDESWLEYVDIGSYGEWGEGHTEWTSKWERPFEVIKKHIDLYLRCYQNTFLMINDDFVTGRAADDPAREQITSYCLEHNLALRDDSISYKGYMVYGNSTLRSPALFELLQSHGPVDLELEHYHVTKANDTWNNGSHLEAATREGHGTFLGFHGFAREWLAENLDVAHRLANLCGYWYFLKGLECAPVAAPGSALAITLLWENHGVAASYYRFALTIRLTNIDEPTLFFDMDAMQSDNRKWLAQMVTAERLNICLPKNIPSGQYSIGVRLSEKCGEKMRMIELGLNDVLRDAGGFYTVCFIKIA